MPNVKDKLPLATSSAYPLLRAAKRSNLEDPWDLKILRTAAKDMLSAVFSFAPDIRLRQGCRAASERES